LITLPRLDPVSTEFPSVDSALDEPNGLLAFGGDLSSERLLAAYARGIFPWYSTGQPILWWSPDPRMVIATAAPHVPRRLKRWIKGCKWTIEADRAFAEVMRHCAESRNDGAGTWITEAMINAYCRLHALGHAHSVEIREGDELIGGIYGVAIGRMFFGESMFSGRDHASKVALLALCRGLASRGYPLLDAQVSSDHLRTLGAFEMPRADFSGQIRGLCAQSGVIGNWSGMFEDTRFRSPGMLAG
jgi:leucyl/phenylalanyl-tRNA---protein transferase